MSLRKTTAWMAGALVLAGALGYADRPAGAADDSSAMKGKAEAPADLIKPGTPAIPFSLQDLDGKTVSIESYAGKNAVVLAFWSFFCGPCREEIPLLDEITKKHAKDGVEMLTVNLDGPKMDKAVRNYMTKNNFGFRVLWEKMEGIRYVTADAYGVAGTPTVVLIGKNGKVTWSHVGRAEAPKIEAEMKKAIAAAE